jgi:hypothetical protein
MPRDTYYTGRLADIDRKANLIADAQRERARRDVRDMRRADAIDQEERREKARRDAERCLEHQRAYDDSFQKFGRRAPAPAADDRARDYRRRLYAIGQSMLPTGHALTRLDPEEIDGTAIQPLEAQLLEALDRESEEPTGDNLPEGEPREVSKMDSATGLRKTEFFGKRSFIHDFARPGRRVARIVHVPSSRVLFGAPFPHSN